MKHTESNNNKKRKHTFTSAFLSGLLILSASLSSFADTTDHPQSLEETTLDETLTEETTVQVETQEIKSRETEEGTEESTESATAEESNESEISTPEETESVTETTPPKADKPRKSVTAVLNNTRSYILSVDTNPDWNSQWYVLANARYGYDPDSKYFKDFYNNAVGHIEEKEGNLSPTQFSEYSKSILTFTSIGYDANDIAGYNLLSYLADFGKVKKQGFNGPVWALMALNSNPSYEIPMIKGLVDQTTERVLLDYILGKELSTGGFTYSGDKADIDMTAITLQALAPYYHKAGYEDVTEAIDRGITVLSEGQTASGGFASMSAENAESCAQVIVALCALGIDCEKDSRFNKDGKWPVLALLEYKVDGSGFKHLPNGSVNTIATAQSYYALVAYNRLKTNQTFLYDMSDVSLKKGPKPEKTEKPTESKEEPTKKETEKDKESVTEKDKEKETEKESEKESTKAPKETTGRSPSKGGGSLNIQKETKKALVTTQAATNALTSSQTETEESATESIALQESGWSFLGEDYIPESSGEDLVSEENLSGADASIKQTSADGSSGLSPLFLGFAGSFAGTLAALFLYHFIANKKKRGS